MHFGPPIPTSLRRVIIAATLVVAVVASSASRLKAFTITNPFTVSSVEEAIDGDGHNVAFALSFGAFTPTPEDAEVPAPIVLAPSDCL